MRVPSPGARAVPSLTMRTDMGLDSSQRRARTSLGGLWSRASALLEPIASAVDPALDDVEHEAARVLDVHLIRRMWTHGHERTARGHELRQRRLSIDDIERRDHRIVTAR